jgi:hypothetical protein
MSVQYSVVRFNPDPARNELLNVGILIWRGADYLLKIDGRASTRIAKGYPSVPSDELIALDSIVRERFVPSGVFDEGQFRNILDRHPGYPVSLTEPRQTHADASAPLLLDRELKSLIERIVAPPKQPSPPDSAPVQALTKELKLLIRKRKIRCNHRFDVSRTGVTRTVDFYVNSTGQLAMDAIRLDFSNENRIVEKADAQAFKVEDIINKNNLRYIVYCKIHEDSAGDGIIADARRIIEGAGAEVLEDLDEAARAMVSAIS